MSVDEAEKAIARILSELEKEHDAHVEEIEVIDVDVTRFGDNRKQLLRGVSITLKRKPGTRWTT